MHFDKGLARAEKIYFEELMKTEDAQRRHPRISGKARAEVDREVRRTMDYEITPEEVKAKLDAGEPFTLLDVREPWEFETARIEGAKLMPMGDVPSRAHQELDPEDHIVVSAITVCAR